MQMQSQLFGLENLSKCRIFRGQKYTPTHNDQLNTQFCLNNQFRDLLCALNTMFVCNPKYIQNV